MLWSLKVPVLSVVVLGLAGAQGAFGQAQPSPGAPQVSAGAAGSPGTTRAATVPGWNDVVATITNGNQTEKVTKGDVYLFMSNYPIPNDEPEAIYSEAVDRVVNTRLLLMFLARQKIDITPQRIDEEIEQYKQRLKAQGGDLATALLQNNLSMDDVRKQIAERLRWAEYLNFNATEAKLRKHLADRKDYFGNTQVRVSHILLKAEPNATAADKDKIKQKLMQIKKEIEGGTITFAAAANKYSEDQANAEGAGGDLDYITLSAGLVEEFTDVAFRLKKGMISDPVETPYGFHLIQVTDRKDGRLPDFEQNKLYIRQDYGAQLQKTIVAAERKSAKIDVKPMPKDFFPPGTGASADAAANATPKASAATGGTTSEKPKN